MKCIECLKNRNNLYKDKTLINGDNAEYFYKGNSYCEFHLITQLSKIKRKSK